MSTVTLFMKVGKVGATHVSDPMEWPVGSGRSRSAEYYAAI